MWRYDEDYERAIRREQQNRIAHAIALGYADGQEVTTVNGWHGIFRLYHGTLRLEISSAEWNRHIKDAPISWPTLIAVHFEGDKLYATNQ